MHHNEPCVPYLAWNTDIKCLAHPVQFFTLGVPALLCDMFYSLLLDQFNHFLLLPLHHKTATFLITNLLSDSYPNSGLTDSVEIQGVKGAAPIFTFCLCNMGNN